MHSSFTLIQVFSNLAFWTLVARKLFVVEAVLCSEECLAESLVSAQQDMCIRSLPPQFLKAKMSPDSTKYPTGAKTDSS